MPAFAVVGVDDNAAMVGGSGTIAAVLRALSGTGGPERPATFVHGMSHDLEVAIEEGATIVRVGTALFGPRKKAAA